MAKHADKGAAAKGAFAELANAYATDVSQLVSKFQVDTTAGLTQAQVEAARAKFGRNEFPPEEGTPLWLLIAKQFEDTLVLILIAAAVVSFVLAFLEEGEEATTAFVEPLVIVAILLANATVGVLQESSAEAAVEALKSYESEHAAVLRGGRIHKVDAGELVPGDIVELEVGNLIPADIRVLQVMSSTMDVAQEILTGEAYNVEKTAQPVTKPDALLQDKTNMLFSGTMVTRGKCRGLVVGTGVATEKGKIRDSLAKRSEQKVPLREKLDDFSEKLSWGIGIICVVVWAINLGHFSDPAFGGWLRGAVFYFKVAVSLAVAAIPEGLPAVVTTCLALGMQRMAKKNAIITALPAVETLGCTQVICSDKTGTLTTNQMSVQRFFVVRAGGADLAEFNVEGNTFEPVKLPGNGAFAVTPVGGGAAAALASPAASSRAIAELARIGTLCNDSTLTWNDETQRFGIVGQSTEAAIKVLSEKLGLPAGADASAFAALPPAERMSACARYWERASPKQFTLEFDRDRKSMSVLVSEPATGTRSLLVKGAWDNVLARCRTVLDADGAELPLTEALRAAITRRIEAYCGEPDCFRCLALARRSAVSFDERTLRGADQASFVQFEENLCFVGLVGIIDPPREAVAGAIRTCAQAGIRVIVITGDNLSTATAICRKIGVFAPGEDTTHLAYTGVQFKQMPAEQRRRVVQTARLFARVEPLDKQELVEALHAKPNNMVVAMTGDGVNDAPALKTADIGIAMGSGTAVAKGAAKMVLADDNFATIVAAVEEGRAIYANTVQFIRYLLTSNIGEVVAIFLTAILGVPEMLLPVQLLWVNLVTDGLPAVALGFNRAEEGIMTNPPRRRAEPIISGFAAFRYCFTGAYIGAATIFAGIWWFCWYAGGPQLTFEQLTLWAKCSPDSGFDCSLYSLRGANAMALSVLVTIEMLQAMNSTSSEHSVFSSQSGPASNLYLLAAITTSMTLHTIIMYVPLLARIFSIVPLGLNEWLAVLAFSAPVILIDEIFKFILRATGHTKVKPKRD